MGALHDCIERNQITVSRVLVVYFKNVTFLAHSDELSSTLRRFENGPEGTTNN